MMIRQAAFAGNKNNPMLKGGLHCHTTRSDGHGTPEEVMANPASLTGQYLSGKKKIPVPAKRREGNGKCLKVIGASENNLRQVDVEIKLAAIQGFTLVFYGITLIYEAVPGIFVFEIGKSEIPIVFFGFAESIGVLCF